MAYNTSGKLATDEALLQIAEKAVETFVAKESGKGLSDNNYTDNEKSKLANLKNYSLPTASTSVLGGVKIGTGLSINADGTVSAADTLVAVSNQDIKDILEL